MGKTAVDRATRAACWAAWRKQLHGETPHPPDWLLTAPDGLTDFNDTCVLPLHLLDHRGSRWYKSLFSADCQVSAPYTKVHMPPRLLRAFCLFRLGTIQLNVQTGRWGGSHVLSRTCDFCQKVCQRRVVEDPYHVCVECPLYECMRMCTYKKLLDRGFDFSSVRGLLHLCVSMLCVKEPSHVRTIGRFLADCMAARDVYTRADSSTWLSNARQQYIADCVRKAPRTCDGSFDFLRGASACDTSRCAPLSEHLRYFWFV